MLSALLHALDRQAVAANLVHTLADVVPLLLNPAHAKLSARANARAPCQQPLSCHHDRRAKLRPTLVRPLDEVRGRAQVRLVQRHTLLVRATQRSPH